MWDYNIEFIRIVYAFIYLSVFSYFDIKNDREIPDKVVYGLSFFAFVLLFTYPFDIIIYGIVQAIIVFFLTYLLYRAGQVGLAEAFSLSSLALIFPIPPSLTKLGVELPFIFFIFIFSGIVFALFIILYTIKKVKKKITFTYKEAVLVSLYLIFLYVFFNSGFGSMNFLLVVSILFFSSFIANVYKEEIKKTFVHRVDIQNANEEVFAYPYASKKEKEVLGDIKLIKNEHIGILKKKGIKKVTIYKMFPFSPFLLVGYVMSLFFSSSILLF